MRKARPFGFLGELFSLHRPGRLSSETKPEASTGYADASEALGGGVPDRTAAEAGDPAAQNSVGIQFAFGPKCFRSDEEARRWLRRAAEQGHADAQFNLGNLFLAASVRHLASGVSEARIEAYRWFHLAAAQGHVRARACSETLNLQLTDPELQEGNRRARAFQSRREVIRQPEGPIK